LQTNLPLPGIVDVERMIMKMLETSVYVASAIWFNFEYSGHLLHQSSIEFSFNYWNSLFYYRK
jgi:hypothetical protein